MENKRSPGNPNWKKGVSPNPKGRPLGSKNRTTTEIRNFIQQVISGQLDNLEQDLSNMSDFQRWLIWEKVAKFTMPSLTKAEVDNNHNGEMNIVVKYQDELSKKNEPMNE